MAAEFSANLEQTVAANGSVIFTASPVPCTRGLIYHRDESGIFRLASPSALGCYGYGCNCGCNNGRMLSTVFSVSVAANVAIPEGGTVGPIQFALAQDGEIDPSSTMIATPAAAGDYWNIATKILVEVPWICRCASVSLRNVGTDPALIQNVNMVIDYLGLRR